MQRPFFSLTKLTNPVNPSVDDFGTPGETASLSPPPPPLYYTARVYMTILYVNLSNLSAYLYNFYLGKTKLYIKSCRVYILKFFK